MSVGFGLFCVSLEYLSRHLCLELGSGALALERVRLQGPCTYR